MTARPPRNPLPDHNDLPAWDGVPVRSTMEPSQSFLLTDSVKPHLRRLHPDERFYIGQDTGIYWLLTDPPLNGCRSPDWYYVPNVSPTVEGQFRRSYVMWQERVSPLVILEYLSDTEGGEWDRTPLRGKFWVYEQAIRAMYYGIHDWERGQFHFHRQVNNAYQLVPPNEHGRYPVPEMGLELGLWHARYDMMEIPWLRWWDTQGNMLPTGEERALLERGQREQAQRQAEQAQRQAEQAQRQAEQAQRQFEQERQARARLAERLRQLGIDPDSV